MTEAMQAKLTEIILSVEITDITNGRVCYCMPFSLDDEETNEWQKHIDAYLSEHVSDLVVGRTVNIPVPKIYKCPCGRKFTTEFSRDLHRIQAHSGAANIGRNLDLSSDYTVESSFDEWEQSRTPACTVTKRLTLWERIKRLFK